ncbi:MAG: tRNA lysidine(34) synthetase TilS, partial [Acidobacteria bacterium]|nr:tRNA lysidine(34) synthetase TilS [Acidobacteriota bacterium]
QAETVLAHLLRGTGVTGLAGIHPVSGHVIRPLLDTRRAELRTFLEERKQDWREDATNSDRTRMRARIRHGLLPVLVSEFSPQIVERLSSLASLAGTEEAAWSAMTESQFVKSVRKSERGFELDFAGLQLPEWFAPLVPDLHTARAAAAAFAQRLVRRILKELQGDAFGITSQHVESVIRLAENKSSGRCLEFPHGIRVEKQFDRLHFWLENSAQNEETCTVASGYEFDVDLSANSAKVVEVLTTGRRFCLKVIDWPAPESETKGLGQALDFAQLCLPLVLRSWRPGDAYRPAGRKRSHKLKELFQRERISLRERHDWPVLTSAGRVVWAGRFPGAADCVPAGSTRKALIISET